MLRFIAVTGDGVGISKESHVAWRTARNPSTGSLAVFMTSPECSGMNADGVGFERLATGNTSSRDEKSERAG